MLKALPQPVSMSTSSGSDGDVGDAANVGQHVFHGADAEVGHAEGVGCDAAAGEIEGAEAGGLGHARGVGVDGADHLQRLFFSYCGAEARPRDDC